MNLEIPHVCHQLSIPSHTRSHRSLPILHHRAWKRRKLKVKFTVRSSLNFNFSDFSSFQNLFHSFTSQFPSVNSLDLIAPALGLASGTAIYLSQFQKNQKLLNVFNRKRNKSVGDWILFTSPTPFNRFVVLRCPSITFEGSELLEDVNERLVKEDRHFLRINSGRIQVNEGDEAEEEKVVYQRVCVRTEDGGVLSLDWPENLDFVEERGLDTTLLIVPGTPQGSLDRDIKTLVCDCLRRGCFPVVMNPRGCAGSPVTTSRLFTAADSDDISTAVHYINKARPWTSLMAIGWGYGANMLTKYLAEVGEKTPLTAATCIDNPFDLDEATSSSPYNISLDQKLTSGLIDILRSNKELFQGRTKGFDVLKALSATSVREFDEAISMVSYGFEEIEDFYAKSSSRELVGKVKIPLLFIQNDNGTVPLFSIPRSLIAENPFTSLLLCSYLPSSEATSCRSTISWCQNVTLEWLAAVELGLLRGRHPLLKDVDVTINPSKGLSLIEGRSPNKNVRLNELLDFPNLAAVDDKSLNHLKDNSVANLHLRSKKQMKVDFPLGINGLQPKNKNSFEQSSDVDTELVEDEVADPVDGERGQVLQTAQVVMNMLDVTMPDTLTEERKKKVLSAVGRGETFMKALQDAVPEDVREKLTTAGSAILPNQESNLKFDKFLGLGQIPDVASRLNSKGQEKTAGRSIADGESDDSQASGQKRVNDQTDGSNKCPPSKSEAAGVPESELQASEDSQKASEFKQSQSIENHAIDILDSDKKGTNDLGNKDNVDFSREKTALTSDYKGNGIETAPTPEGAGGSAGIEHFKEHDGGRNQTATAEEIANKQIEMKTVDSSIDQTRNTLSSHTEDTSPLPYKGNGIETAPKPEGAGGSDGIEHFKEHDGGRNQTATGEEISNKQIEMKTVDSSVDQTRNTSSSHTEDTSPLPTSPAEFQTTETDCSDNVKREEKIVQQPGSNPSFNVSVALDALTGVDDSTQVAVKNVFNVIEDMISQWEDGRDNEDEDKDRDNGNEAKGHTNRYKSNDKHVIQDREVGLVNENQLVNGNKLEELAEKGNDNNMPLGGSDDTSNQLDAEEKSSTNTVLFRGNHTDSYHISNSKNYMKEENGGKQYVDSKSSSKRPLTHIYGISKQGPLYITTYLYGDPLDNEYLRKYLISRLRTTKPLDLDTTRALFLDYFPEEGQWKLLEQREDNNDIIEDVESQAEVNSKAEAYLNTETKASNNIIEPSYIILDSKRQQERVEKAEKTNSSSDHVKMGCDTEDPLLFVKNVILDTLKVEAERRLGTADIEDVQPRLSRDLELIADAVCLSVGQEEENVSINGKDHAVEKFGTLNGEDTVRAISMAFNDTSYLKTVLPLGVVVGSSLASIRKYFVVGTVNSDIHGEDVNSDQVGRSRDTDQDQLTDSVADKMLHEKTYQKHHIDNLVDKDNGKLTSKSSNGKTVVVGAVTAALGASALLVDNQNAESNRMLSKPFKDENIDYKGNKNVEGMSESTQNNIVTSLAEKAMSVAGPVVPTKEDGEVDQERLVAMLAELGQRGGILKLVGKLALLWGGIRGAMSLTDKLISFLRMAERPLFQRILGFIGMVFVLWSPVVVPLLPTLMQSWGTHNSSKIAEFACIVGLYVAILLMVALWGKRIRAYADPFEQYGLRVNSPLQVQKFVTGLIGGVIIVLTIHSVNILCGFVQPCWPAYVPSSSVDAVRSIKLCGRMLLLVLQALLTATSVAVVEELLFRSWLPDEITADCGNHRAIIISGLAFSLSQRSPWSIPGLWLLSIALAGARQRSQGSLSLPIGLRAGILICSFFLQRGGFLTYQPNLPVWLSGSNPFQPFSGVVGLAFCLSLAIVLYPSQTLHGEKKSRVIRE